MKDTNKIILNKELLNLKIIEENSNYSNILNINHILENESIELSNLKITKIDLKHSNKLNINQILESEYIDFSNIEDIVLSKKKIN